MVDTVFDVPVICCYDVVLMEQYFVYKVALQKLTHFLEATRVSHQPSKFLAYLTFSGIKVS